MPINRTETGFGPGATGASNPRTPGAPIFVSNGSGSITFDIDENGNAPEVMYALRITEDGSVLGYVQANLSIGAGEVFQTPATWGNVTVSGLTDFIPYTFAAKGKSELAVETAWSAESANMNTLPDIDEGIEQRTPIKRQVTGGNVRVEPTAGIVISGDLVPEATETEYYGVVIASYTLESYDSDTATVEVEYSEDDGETWATATSKTGEGDGKTGLVTTPAGTAHTFAWDSYPDAGESEYQTEVKLRIRASDAEGDFGEWVESDTFRLRNLPGELVFDNADSREWDEDTTPVFVATMPFLRGGSRGYPVISIYDASDGATLVTGYPKKSVESQAGWEYESPANTWNAMTAGGIPDTALRVRYTVQTAIAVGDYLVRGKMGEVRDRG